MFNFRGYMAPEYLAGGRLTEKVDVYSYGVLVLEIISGVENNNYHSEDILSTLVTTVSFSPFFLCTRIIILAANVKFLY